MFTARERVSTCITSAFAALMALSGIVAVCADTPSETASVAPRVSAITQVTHDGVTKTGLLSDDSHLYVTEWRSARHELVKFSLKTGERSSIPSKFSNVQALDVSNAGGRLLVTPIQGGSSATEFWVLPVQAGNPQKLGFVSGRDAAWSADGRQLVFSKGSTLYVANGDGTAAHEVFSAEGSVFNARFSPDGKRIRFSVGNTSENTTSIWEVGRDGSNPQALMTGWKNASSACCGTWSSDGSYYVFQVTQTSPSTLTTLWALPESGSDPQPVQLTQGPTSFGNVTTARNNNSGVWAIGVQPAGQPVKYDPKTAKFSALLPGVSATDLEFSSDGKWVTYVSVPEGSLWRSKADGTDRLQLTAAPERTALPHWSPDGKNIAYVSMKPGQPWKILIVSAQGGAPATVFEESRSQIDANWSPDGTRIMYGYLHDGEQISIRVVDLNSHEVTSIPGSEGLFSPRWSPDGRYIAALSPDYTKVMLYDFNTAKWTTWVSEAAGAVSYPVWSADSKYVYFDDLVTDEESIRRIKVGDSSAEKVFKLEGIERYPGPFGLWSGRMPDGSWMFIRDHSTQEVYRLQLALR